VQRGYGVRSPPLTGTDTLPKRPALTRRLSIPVGSAKTDVDQPETTPLESIAASQFKFSAIAFRLRTYRGAASSPATPRASQPLHHISEQCVPPGKPREGLGLRGSRVAALALEGQNVLAEMIGESDDGKWLARRHHPPIVANARSKRPYSSIWSPILYKQKLRSPSQNLPRAAI
jgi:hypothetical protein